MAKFDLPGKADAGNAALVNEWNRLIAAEFARRQSAGRFLVEDPGTIANGVTTDLVRWSCAPAEPESCFGTSVARALSDWGWRGRQELHNEYAEYAVIYRFDGAGRRRPKRVEITTELREYWVAVATEQPELVRQMATAVLGSQVTMEDLYGDDVGNVDQRSKVERQARFSYYTAGGGGFAQPQGRLNRDRALFMTHPINGLDDLVYIVAFGAHPYAVRTANGYKRASLEEVFIAKGVKHLYCRHADSAAAAGAHKQAFEGRQVAFANPLGVYIQSFAKSRFFVVDTDDDVPNAWVKMSRGDQRLEFGPPDEDPRFLDDIAFEIGGDIHRLEGGFDVVAATEVGPNLVVGGPSDLTEADLAPYVLPAGTGGTIRCGESARCRQLEAFKAAYEAARPIGMGPQTPRG